MQTFQEAASEWAKQNPGANWGGTASVPPAEFIRAYEATKLATRVEDLERRLAGLEGRVGGG